MSEFKSCGKCHQEKPVLRFPKHPNAADGRISTCQDCVNALAKINRVKFKEKHAKEAKTKRVTYKEVNKANELVLYSEDNLEKLRTCPGCGLSLAQKLFQKDISKFTGFSTYCKNCSSARKKDRYNNDPGVKERIRLCAQKPSNKLKAQEWRDKNRDLIKFLNAEWRRNNPGKARAHNARWRKSALMAMPDWVKIEEIEKIYLKSEQLSRSTGVQHHVDHRVPLVNKNVCGLHVPWNLEPVTSTENVRKHNKFIEELGVCMDAPGIRYLSQGCPPITWTEILALP